MKYCLLVLSALLVMASCDKVEEPESKEDIMRGGKWKLSKDIVKTYRKAPGDTLIINDTIRLAQMDECKKDDYLEFREGIEGALNTGAIKCPQGETNEIAIKWGFLDNDTRMYIYEAGDMLLGHDDVVGKVDEFTSSSFRIKYNIINNLTDIPKKDTVTYTVTFNKF